MTYDNIITSITKIVQKTEIYVWYALQFVILACES